MRKQNLAIALVASMFIAVPVACSSSSSDGGTTNGGDGGGGGGGGGDGGGGGGSGDSGSGGGGDSGTSNTDSGSGTDSGLLPDGGSGITGCGDPGDPGNSLGIGKYCTVSCPSGLFCATLGGGPNFCTNVCTALDAGGSPTACGAGASCQCQGGECGCTPDACL